MNILSSIKNIVLDLIAQEYHLTQDQLCHTQIILNADKPKEFGDLNCNAAMVLAKLLKQQPLTIAQHLQNLFMAHSELQKHVKKIEIANPGFLNFFFKSSVWHTTITELYSEKEAYFKLPPTALRQKYLIEFVSANPTGPLHLGHGRGGIIGDVLANVLNFLGHHAEREFYINDAGNQIKNFGASFKARCYQALGKEADIPEKGYAGDYLITLAAEAVAHHGATILDQDDQFFAEYATQKMLERIKITLANYGIQFDRWFSEKSLHQHGFVDKAIELLNKKNLTYTHDGALWFKSTEFGDDKDRVLKKNDEAYTYIAADIAYHQNKFERGYNVMINILGQDHHGYVKRLKATMQALGYDAEKLDVILYQLVKIKHGEEFVKMSKRRGTFEKLEDVIETVGRDVARFFYLNRKADAHLEFDLDAAIKKTDENPVYYIQYAYVRTNSVLTKAIAEIGQASLNGEILTHLEQGDIDMLKKICSLETILGTVAQSYQTHLLAYYTLELAQLFHNYYAHHKIIDKENPARSHARLALIACLNQTLYLCLDLLGLDKPERM